MSGMEENALAFVRELFQGDGGGHGPHHTLRVYRTALALLETEGGDRETVVLAALLHDADDPKLFATEDLANAREFLQRNHASQALEEQVCAIIRQVSFRGGGAVPDTPEGRIVQDADRLDAMGAVGIARCFAYGGSRGRAIHDPEEGPRPSMTAAEYAANRGTSINHFYEKLLRLKDLMNTPAARRLAQARHAYMESFLEEFYAEWEGRT